MQFGILGPLEVRAGDAVVEIPRANPRRLLVALALRVGETLSTSVLMDLLWRDDPPRNPANALQIQVSYLRKVLSAASTAAAPLATRPGGYALDVPPEQVDAIRFEKMTQGAAELALSGTARDLAAALGQLDAALGLWRGTPLAELAGEPFALGEATRLEELRWAAVEARNDVLLALGRHRELVGELGRLANAQPLRERFHEQLMVALYRAGRQAEALRAYEQAREILVEQLGIDPGPGLQRLERDVLAHDPALEWAPPPGDEAGASPVSGSPPPPGRIAAATPLPAPVTTLVGREVETARVRELLDRSRLVTLTGPGGTGKSRLALELAHAAAATADVWFVDFTGVAAPELVAPTVAAALGVPTPPEEDAADAVARALSPQEGLLVVDTCEHVVTGVAELVARVLRHSPRVRVLATSRRPLRITAEIAWPVPPLALPPPSARTAQEVAPFPAVALFAERASAVRPDFTLTDATAADVAAICLALDGLPLAIELAAARTDLLTPAAIRARLQNRFDLLVEGGRDLAARQQTLRSEIDWSFELLDADQRRFFARLGAFAGSFDLDAAVTVAGDGFADPLGLLAALVRQSMVVVAGDDRYRLLDTLRAYALELDVDDGHETRRRHARFYAELAESAESGVRGPAQTRWLERLRADMANLRAALEWAFSADEEMAARLAGALAWFWTLDGMLDEAIQHLERALAVGGLPARVRAKVLCGLGLLTASLGQLERARAAGAESTALAREDGDDAAIGYGLNTLAVAEWALGDLEAAAAAHDEAIRRFEAAGNAWGHAVCMVLRARTALDGGECAAVAMARAALPVARGCGDRHVVGIALEQLARAGLAAGNIDEAVAAASDALAAHESIGYTEGIIAALHLLGESRAAAGDLEDARALHVRALQLSSRIGHAAATCEALEDLARIAVAEGGFDQALRLLAVARRERAQRNLPLRPPDQRDLDDLERSAKERIGASPGVEPASASATTPLSEVISELLASRRPPSPVEAGA